LVREVNTEHARSLALQCIERCIRDHDECIKPQDTILPTRVIDCSNPAHPRLVTTHGKKSRYITLSYVWGESQPHSTTTLNLASYHQGIDPGHLPQTIKDAISTTHALGFRYLWADTLCIVQDSVEDKVREIAQMAQIYTDAFLTIIAASASKVSEGFLQDRNDLLPPSAIVRFVCPGNDNIGTVCLFDSLTRPYLPRDPVALRGWCLQESVLSARALVFASHTLQYHCNEGIVNVGNSLTTWTPQTDLRFPRSFFSVSCANVPAPTTDDTQWYDLRKKWWWNLVDYTHRSITNPADKLVALAGVAQQCQRIYQTRYLAGLWEDSLLKDLLWISDPAVSPSSRPKAYRAPSWSWAALDGPIGNIDGYTTRSKCIRTCVEVVRCEVMPSREELPFGEVKAGVLVLRARIIKVMLELSRDGSGEGIVYLPRPTYERLLLKRNGRQSGITGSEERITNRIAIGKAKMDSSDDYEARAVSLVIIWTNAEWSGADGLLLVSADPPHASGKVRYRRVGSYQQRIRGKAGDFGWLEWLNGAPEVEVEIV
jgi:hypothetical protein